MTETTQKTEPLTEAKEYGEAIAGITLILQNLRDDEVRRGVMQAVINCYPPLKGKLYAS